MNCVQTTTLSGRMRSDESGNIAIMGAAFMLVAVSACALAIDLGSLYLQRRTEQGAADLAAIAAAADLSRPETAARATLAANGVSQISSLIVKTGHYEADSGVEPGKRFKAGVTPINGASVELTTTGRQYFSKIFWSKPIAVTVSASAATNSQASFSLGSRLASLNGGIINTLLGALIGGNVSLSLVDYNALASADVKLFDFMNALASEVHVTAGTYDDVLSSSANIGDVIDALASVTRQNGDTSANLALKSLAQLNANKTVPLKQVIDLGPLASLHVGDPEANADAAVSVMQLISSSVMVANGQHQLAIDLGASVPGIANLKLQIAVGEPMQHTAWLAVGQTGSKISTAQVRILLLAQVGGTGILQGASLKLPVFVDLAYAQARLANVACSTPAAGTAQIATVPGIAEAWIGELQTGLGAFGASNSVVSAKIVTTALLKVTGSAHVQIGNINETMLDFDMSDVANRTIKQTDTRNALESLVTSLVSDLNLNVTTLGLSLNSPKAVQTAVAAALKPAASVLDTIVYQIISTLGVHLGQADVRVNGIRCRGAVLAG